MAKKGLLGRLTTPVHELDREALTEWCDAMGSPPYPELPLRKPVDVFGEVRSVRIVPRAGADALEATLSDGRGTVTAVFLGRRRISGISPGRRLRIEGVVALDRGQRVIFNPRYRLL